MKHRGLAITGKPGVGKSTVFNRIVDQLKELECKVGGISAPEVRISGKRVGFLIVDLNTNARGWLAKVSYQSPYKLGRYGIIVNDVKRIGINAIVNAIKSSDIIGIDEIGPMELKVPEMRNAIINALRINKTKLLVFHRELPRRDPEVYSLISNLKIIEVTFNNRKEILMKTLEYARWLSIEAGCNRRRESTNINY